MKADMGTMPRRCLKGSAKARLVARDSARALNMEYFWLTSFAQCGVSHQRTSASSLTEPVERTSAMGSVGATLVAVGSLRSMPSSLSSSRSSGLSMTLKRPHMARPPFHQA